MKNWLKLAIAEIKIDKWQMNFVFTAFINPLVQWKRQTALVEDCSLTLHGTILTQHDGFRQKQMTKNNLPII